MAKPLLEREHRHRYLLLRSFPLLLLVFYATVSILKLSLPPSPPPSASLLRPSDSSSNDAEKPLKTHISSNEHHHLHVRRDRKKATSIPCSSLIDGSKSSSESFLCCNRSNYRTDVCYVKGDIRTDPGSPTIHLHNAMEGTLPETIRPYTRKWEVEVMSTIGEVTLRPAAGSARRCDVHHKGVPAVLFSAGGYTGNVYHDFNDGLIPLYATTGRFTGEVVLVVTEYQSWWYSKYKNVLKRMTKYRVVDLAADHRVHCFSDMVVGLTIHGELSIDPHLMADGRGIRDFQALLAQGLGGPLPPPRLPPAIHRRVPFAAGDGGARPLISIFVRHKSRVLYNLKEIIKACQRVGFDVQTVDPRRTTPLAEIYAALNASSAMLAVHGAAVTHFLFMRPGCVLIQIVPLGLDWAAETYYGEPARRLGLDYVGYRVAPEESSLLRAYGRRDPVIVDPGVVTRRGWSETKRVYLDGQNIRVNLVRFGKVLEKAHARISRRHAADV